MKRKGQFSQNIPTKFVVHPASVKLLADATWDFAHWVLWCGYPLTNREITLFKYHIRIYYEGIPSELFTQEAAKYFIACCKRILIAREFIRWVPH